MKLSMAMAATLLSVAPVFTSAWSVVPVKHSLATLGGVASRSSVSATRLYNVPPPAMDDAVANKEFSDREGPPSSFYQLQINCVRAAKLAIADGFKLIEVEVCTFV